MPSKLINYDNKRDAKQDKEHSERNNTGKTKSDGTPFDISSIFNAAAYEDVIQESALNRENNCYIVYGRDRECGWDTGYSKKATDCGAIDIVVGRFPTQTAQVKSADGTRTYSKVY